MSSPDNTFVEGQQSSAVFSAVHPRFYPFNLQALLLHVPHETQRKPRAERRVYRPLLSTEQVIIKPHHEIESLADRHWTVLSALYTGCRRFSLLSDV